VRAFLAGVEGEHFPHRYFRRLSRAGALGRAACEVVAESVLSRSAAASSACACPMLATGVDDDPGAVAALPEAGGLLRSRHLANLARAWGVT
jgi:hypothetical protein